MDLPKGKLLSFQLKKISIIHDLFYAFHMHEYNDSSLLSKIYFSKEYGRIVIFIYNFKKNNFLMFKLKYELIIHKWLKALYNFLTLIVFFLMEISTTESAEIKFLIHQNADFLNSFWAKIFLFLTY